MGERAWRGYLIVGVLATGVYFVLPTLAWRNHYYDAVGLSSVAAIVLGVRLHRPPRPVLWYLFAAGQLLFVVGDMTFSYYELVLHVQAPVPSFADVSYLAGYPVVAAGLVMLIRERSPGRDRAGLIDAAMVAAGVGVLSWVYLMVPYARDPSLSQLERWVSISYPLGDVLLLALAARLLVAPGFRTRSFRLLGTSLVFLLAADSVYTVLSLKGTYYSGHLIDGAWLLSYVLWGAAALHPSMRALSRPAPDRQSRLSPARLAVLASASLLPPTVLAIQAARGRTLEAPVIAGASAILFMLVVARMAGLVREVASKADQLRAKGEALATSLQDLERAQAERAALLDRTLRAAEEERVRIAGELHDGPLQKLAELSLTMERAQTRIERGDLNVGIDLLGRTTTGLASEIQGLRRMMSDLRPPALDERGLAAALHDQVEAFGRRTGIASNLEWDFETRLEPEVETVLYRAVQEAFANVAKHANAEHAWVSLHAEDGHVVLKFRDDGVGFDVGALPRLVRDGHFGLVAMRERVEMAGGRVELRSTRGGGTSISVWFPREMVGVVA